MANLDEHIRRRYARQIALPEFGEAGQQRLAESRVLLVGLGGLGSPAALYLAAAGVGHLTLVDFDEVDETNLQRQVLYTASDAGRPKLDAAAEAHRQAIERTPNHAPYHMNLADTLLRQDLPHDAAQAVDAARALDPRHPLLPVFTKAVKLRLSEPLPGAGDRE